MIIDFSWEVNHSQSGLHQPSSLYRAPTTCKVLCQVLGYGLHRCLDVSNLALKVGSAGSVLPECCGPWKRQELPREWTITLFWYSDRRLHEVRLELSEEWSGLGKPEKPRQDCKQRTQFERCCGERLHLSDPSHSVASPTLLPQTQQAPLKHSLHSRAQGSLLQNRPIPHLTHVTSEEW